MASFTMLVYALDSKRPVPYAPVRPLPMVTPQAGDTVTLRGKDYTAVVLGVEIDHDDFDEPKFYLSNGAKVTRYAITGVMESRVAA